MTLRAIDHITLPASDLQRAEAFYVDLLGAELVRRFDREAFVRAHPERAAEADALNSPLHLELQLGDGPQLHVFLRRDLEPSVPAAHPHLAVRVDPDQLDGYTERLTRAGVPCDGPRRLGPPGHASLYFADPWGHLLELVTTAYQGDVQLGPPIASKLGHRWRA
jgi:catechol 2,3-dioxygenase-like lactoylglutathione lyase family enzyme